MDPELALDAWYRALKSETGVAVCPADPTDLRALQNFLYKIRDEHNDPELDKVILCLPDGGKEIWLCRKTVELGDAAK